MYIELTTAAHKGSRIWLASALKLWRRWRREFSWSRSKTKWTRLQRLHQKVLNVMLNECVQMSAWVKGWMVHLMNTCEEYMHLLMDEWPTFGHRTACAGLSLHLISSCQRLIRGILELDVFRRVTHWDAEPEEWSKSCGPLASVKLSTDISEKHLHRAQRTFDCLNMKKVAQAAVNVASCRRPGVQTNDFGLRRHQMASPNDAHNQNIIRCQSRFITLKADHILGCWKCEWPGAVLVLFVLLVATFFLGRCSAQEASAPVRKKAETNTPNNLDLLLAASRTVSGALATSRLFAKLKL